MESDSSDFNFFEQSGDRLTRFYVDLAAQAEEKLQPSSRYRLGQDQNPKVSIDANIRLLQEAQLDLDSEWENVLYIYELIKKSGDHQLLIQYVDSLTPYLGYRGEWLMLGQWLEDGVAAAQARSDPESIGSYLLDLGWLAEERGEWEKGLQHYNRVLNLLEETPFPLLEAITHLRLGWLYNMRDDRKKSQQCFKKSLKLYKEIDNPIGTANATLGLGSLLSDIEEWEEGEKQLKVALDIYTQIGDSTGVASAYNNLASLALHKGKTALAREYYLEDLAIMKQIQIKQDLAQVELALGGLEVSAGNCEMGMEYLLAAQSAFSELGSYPDLADVYWAIAAAYIKKDEIDTAIEYYQMAAQIYVDLDIAQSFAQVTRQIALAFSAKGDNNTADKFYRIAHDHFVKLIDPRGIEKEIIGNASRIFDEERDYYSLLELYESLRTKMVASESLRGLAHVHIALGDTHSMKNRQLDQAITSYGSALSCFESLQDAPGIAEVKSKLGDVYRNLERWDDAILNYSNAISFYQSVGDNLNLGWTNNWLGICYFHKREWNHAFDAHLAALQARSKEDDICGVGWSHLNIGELFQAQGNEDDAILHFRAAYEFAHKCNNLSLAGWAYAGVGDIYLEKDNIQQAIQFYLKSIEVRTQLQDRSSLIWSLVSIGHAYKRCQQFEDSLQAFQEALQISKDLGEVHNIADRYLDLAELHVNMDRQDEALTLYQMTEQIFSETNNHQGLAITDYAIAKIFNAKAQFVEEISYYKKWLFHMGYAPWSLGNIANVYALLGDAYSNNGQPEQGIEPYQKCLEILAGIDAPAATASAYLGLGIIYGKLGLVEKDIEAHENALKHAEKSTTAEDLGLFQGWLADSYFKAKQFDRALKYYFRSVATYEQFENIESQIKTHGKIALTYWKMGIDEKLKEYADKAASLINNLQDQEQKEDLIRYVRFLFDAEAR